VIALVLAFLLGEPVPHALAEFSDVIRSASKIVRSFSQVARGFNNVVRRFSNVIHSFLVLPERQRVAHSCLVLP